MGFKVKHLVIHEYNISDLLDVNQTKPHINIGKYIHPNPIVCIYDITP